MASLKRMEQILEDPEMIRPENLHALLNEILHTFIGLQSQIESNDEEARSKAIEMLGDLKEKLEKKAHDLSQLLGLEQSEIESYMNDPSQFNRDEWSAIEESKEHVADFNKTFSQAVNNS